jgi:hypothetical protein
LWVVEAVVADHGVQGQDTVVGQGEDGLVVTFPLLVFALVVGPGDGAGAREAKEDRNIVKPRVLWRLVYLVRVVAGCDCSRLFWLMSGTQAAAWSTGVRIPMAE